MVQRMTYVRSVSATVLLVLALLVSACSSEGAEQAPRPSDPTSSGSLTGDNGATTGGSAATTEGQSPDFVRFIQPEEWQEVSIDCLRAEGFSVTALRDGGISYENVPESQAEAVTEATALCQRKYPIDPRFEQPLTQAQREYLYGFYLESISCLERLGFSDIVAPSRETFVETYGGEGSWSPFLEAYEQNQAGVGGSWTQVVETCPQQPATDELYAAELLE